MLHSSVAINHGFTGLMSDDGIKDTDSIRSAQDHEVDADDDMMATRLVSKVDNQSNANDYESINEREIDSQNNNIEGTGPSIPEEMIINSEEYGKNLSGNDVEDQAMKLEEIQTTPFGVNQKKFENSDNNITLSPHCEENELIKLEQLQDKIKM